jgi:outer membrane protein TolC
MMPRNHVRHDLVGIARRLYDEESKTMKRVPTFLFLLPFIQFAAGAQQVPPALTLDGVLASALAAGPVALRLEREAESARLELKRIRAENGISLAAEGGYARLGVVPGMAESPLLDPGDTVRTGIAFGSSSTKATLSGGLSWPASEPDDPLSTLSLKVNQTLWDGFAPGGKSRAAMAKAKLNFQVRELESEAKKRDYAYQVRGAFFLVLDSQRILGFRLETLKQREDECKRTAAYLEFKRASDLDMSQAVLDKDEAAREAEYARLRLDLDRKKLIRLAGLEPRADFLIQDPGDPAPPEGELASALKIALAERTELKQMELLIAMADIDVRLAASQSSPTVAAEAGLDWNRSWPDGDDIGSFSAGVGLSLPVIDGGRAAAIVGAARNEVEILKMKREETRRSVSIEVEESSIDFADAVARLALAERSRDQLRARQALAEARFQQGLSSRWDVLQANLALTGGEAGYLAARKNYRTAALGRERAMGK